MRVFRILLHDRRNSRGGSRITVWRDVGSLYKERKRKVSEAKKNQSKKQSRNTAKDDFYDYDDELDAYVCTVNLDEDELERFVLGRAENCPYYRFYDEYKSVQKQN